MELLRKLIEGLKAILSDEEALKYVMKKELKILKKEYAIPRKTQIVDEITEIKLDLTSMIQKENVHVVVTNEGYVKRVSTKSFNSSDGDTLLKPGDYIANLFETSTLDNLVLFTNLGNYLFIPVYKIFEAKWKELGKHISNIVPLQEGERLVASFILEEDTTLTLFTKNGMVKNILMQDLIVTRYSKTMTAIKLKEDDELVNVSNSDNETLIITKNGYYLRYNTEEIPVVGPKASGVKGINLSDDEVIYGGNINEASEYLDIFTNNNTAKRVKLTDLKSLSRAKKGNMLIKKNKTVTYSIVNAYITNARDTIIIKSDSEIKEIKNSEIPIMDLASNGSSIGKGHIDKFDLKYNIITSIKKDEDKEIKKEVKEKDKQVSFEDFAKDFKL